MNIEHEKCIICEHEQLKTLIGYESNFLVKCKKCGMVFSKRIPSKDELNDLYYQYSYNNDKTLSVITKKRYQALLDKFEKYRFTNKLLDYGCGKGDFLVIAKERGWQVYGFDPSIAAQNILKKKGINIIDAENQIDLPQNTFDVVVSIEVLEHLVNPMNALKNIYKMLRNGGLFYLTVPNFNAWARYKLKNDYPIIVYPEHISFFTKKTIKKALNSTKFFSVRTKTTGLNIAYIKKRPSRNNQNSNFIYEESDNKRALFEKPILKIVKNSINFILSVLGIGETLKATAIKK